MFNTIVYSYIQYMGSGSTEHQIITAVGVILVCVISTVQLLRFYGLPVGGIIIYTIFYSFLAGLIFMTSTATPSPSSTKFE